MCCHRSGSLLHCLFTLTARSGGSFLLRFPEGFPCRTLSGILPCEARTFLVSRKGAAAVCPARPILLLQAPLRQVLLFSAYHVTAHTLSNLGKRSAISGAVRALYIVLRSPLHCMYGGVRRSPRGAISDEGKLRRTESARYRPDIRGRTQFRLRASSNPLTAGSTLPR